MWYKQENNEWLIGNKIEFPNGDILQDNHEETKDEWIWYDEPPQEYLDYLNENKLV